MNLNSSITTTTTTTPSGATTTTILPQNSNGATSITIANHNNTPVIYNSNDWDFFWADVHWIFDVFDHLHLDEHQRVNHFRNHYELTRKDLLVKNMKRTQKFMEQHYGRDEARKFDFLSTTFVLPREYGMLQEEFKKNPKSIWIMKPIGKSQGRGIFLFHRLSQISQWRKDPRGIGAPANDSQPEVETYIAQKYIDNPYLIGGKKFDIRIYALVTSYNPLVVYIHRIGFCRFSNYQYSLAKDDISNMFIHATNVAIQKTSPEYNGDKGCKWQLRNLRMYLASKHGTSAADHVFTEMEALVVRSLMSVQKVMIHDKHCFELYGYDILLDDKLKPWLLEVNASPSLSAENQQDYESKFMVLNDMMDILDMERRFVDQGIRKTHNGFDLVYMDGPVQQEKCTRYVSRLGGYVDWKKRPPKKLGKSRGNGGATGGGGSTSSIPVS